MARAHDLRVYYVTDVTLSQRLGLIETTLEAVRGGATLVQLRHPDAKAGALLEQARALIESLAPFGIPLIINDRPDVAKAAGAAGVHVGQGDLPPEAARAILGPKAIIGFSITHPAEMAKVPWDVVDHLGVGPVLSKGVKPDASEPIGFEGLAACVRLSRRPVVAIGGMTAACAQQCIAAGADGLAVVSAIAGSKNPRAAAATIRSAVDQALAAREAL